MRAARRWNASFLALVVLLVSFVAIVPQPASAAVQAGDQSGQYTVWTFVMVGGTYTGNTKEDGTKKTEGFIDGHSIHVSCSQQFDSGWANDGTSFPQPSDGAQYEILSYQIQRFDRNDQLIHTCGETFTQEDPEVVVSVDVGDCTVSDSGHSKTTYYVSIQPSEGAVVVVTGAGGYLATFPADGGSDRVRPGTYNWEVQVADGYSYDGPLSGSFTTYECDEGETEVGISVTVGGCFCDGEISRRPYHVNIDPAFGATVTVTGPDGYEAVYTGHGGADIPPPGTYYWTATVTDGFTPAGPLEGVFVLEPCEQPHEELAVSVTTGPCVWNGEESLGTYELIIDPAHHATVTVTGPDGYEKVFTESGSDTVPPGDYEWTAVLPHGWTTVDPLEGSFTIDSCEPDFAALGDLVWHDVDGDGIQGAGEPGIEGVTVHLIHDGSTVATTTTDAAGIYGFTDLLAGDYTVEFEAPEGWIVTATDQGGDDSLDSDGLTVSTNLSEGETDLTLDLGLLQYATITVEKIIDPSTDDVFDFTGDIEASLGDGESASAQVLPGEYSVTETLPENWLLADLSCTAGGAGDVATGVATYTVESGDSVTCTYTNTNVGTVVIEKTTDTDTEDVFTFLVGDESHTLAAGESVALDLPSGTYTISEDLLVIDGWELLDVICSDGAEVDLENASAALYVPPGETVGCTFVNSQAAEPLGVLGDLVWFDVDADGIQDATEIGVDGATVDLFVAGAASPLMTTTSNEAGIYVLANVPGGDYQVRFTTPDGWMFTNADTGDDDAMDSDVVHMVAEVSASDTEQPSVGLTEEFTLAPGASDMTIDAGIFRIQVQDVVGPPPKTPPASTPGVGTPGTPDVGTPDVGTPDVGTVAKTPDVPDTRVLAAQAELPMTGLSNGGLSVVALVLLGGGAILLATTRRREEELATATSFGARLRR